MTRLDRLLAVLEPYAAGRVVERDLRRQMIALRCEANDGEGLPRCYLYKTAEDEAGWCDPCRTRAGIYRLFKTRRAANKALLRRVEALALALQVPEPSDEPEEPKLLLELMT